MVFFKRVTVFAAALAFLIPNCKESNFLIKVSNLKTDSAIRIPLEIKPGIVPSRNNALVATSTKNGHEFILQKTPSLFYSDKQDIKTTFCAHLPQSIEEGEYEISPVKQEAAFSFSENNSGKLTILEGKESVLAYNFGMQLPEGVPERYRRSSYIHPVYDLDGNILTADFPGDHYHHRGLSWMWPKVFVNSIRYDLWPISVVSRVLQNGD